MTSSSMDDRGERQTHEGRWEELKRSWWDPKVVNCEMCGQMIPRDVWKSADGHSFCSVDCDDLYRSYWLPRYGGKGAKPGE